MTHFLSMNIRGLGDASKQHRLRNIIKSGEPCIILCQETLSNCVKAINTFLSICKGWSAVAVDAVGHSGGLIALWDPIWGKFKAYKFYGGILLTGHIRGFAGTLNIVNLYAPYQHRLVFWNKFKFSVILYLRNLIVMGNFNSTMNLNEIWGDRARGDGLADFLHELFTEFNMVDIHPMPIIPTWKNKRIGSEFIGKRLDRAMVKDNLIISLGLPRTEVLISQISDHMPILLSWRVGDRPSGLHFKFNRAWLADKEFVQLIQSTWS